MLVHTRQPNEPNTTFFFCLHLLLNKIEQLQYSHLSNFHPLIKNLVTCNGISCMHFVSTREILVSRAHTTHTHPNSVDCGRVSELRTEQSSMFEANKLPEEHMTRQVGKSTKTLAAICMRRHALRQAPTCWCKKTASGKNRKHTKTRTLFLVGVNLSVVDDAASKRRKWKEKEGGREGVR